MDNYICINGKKAELTAEQLKALGIELPKPSPFERVGNTANTFYNYYFISSTGSVDETYDGGYCNGNGTDDLRYRTANYCTDKEIMEQRALHETLNRLLWRYSMEHDGNKIVWDLEFGKIPTKFFIHYKYGIKKPHWAVCNEYNLRQVDAVYFYTKEIAEAAIKEIIEPFMKAHPEFKF